MELFALTENDITPDVVKIVLDKETNKKVSDLFTRMEDDFKRDHPDAVAYSADYKPEKNEHFFIADFVEHNVAKQALVSPKAVTVLDINTIPLEKIKAIFIGSKDGNTIFLQKFDKGQVITNTRSLFFFDNTKTFSSPENNGLTIGPKLTGIVNGNTINFKNFNALRRIFDMDHYFKEATDGELTDFQKNEVFFCEEGLNLADFKDTVIRRKVTLLNMSGVLKEHTIHTLQKAAIELDHPLDLFNHEGIDKIKMPNNKKDVKLLLNFLDSDIYISVINGFKYKSTSKLRITE